MRRRAVGNAKRDDFGVRPEFIAPSILSTFLPVEKNVVTTKKAESSSNRKPKRSSCIDERVLVEKCTNSNFSKNSKGYDLSSVIVKKEYENDDTFVTNFNIPNSKHIKQDPRVSSSSKNGDFKKPSSLLSSKVKKRRPALRKSWAPLYLVPRGFDKKKLRLILYPNSATSRTEPNVKAPENDFLSLQTFCRKNHLVDPSYVIPISVETKFFTCRCTVLVDNSDFMQFLETIGVEKTIEQSKLSAARKMRERLEKLLVVLKTPRFKYLKKKRMGKLRLPQLGQSILDRVIKTEPDENDGDIFVNRGENNLLSSTNGETFVKMENIIPKEKKDDPLNDTHERIRRSKTWVESTTPVRLKLVNHSIENYPVKSEGIAGTRDSKLSDYHKHLKTRFGLDLRKKIAKKVERLVKYFDNKNHERFFIDEKFVELNEILAVINVQVNNSLFVAHNGRYIRVIHIDTIPGIVEVEEGHDYVNLGLHALSRAVDRLKKILL